MVVLLFGLLCLLWSQTAGAAPVSGVVYDANSGKPISGVRLQIFYDDSDSSEPGLLVPSDRLQAREQNQLSRDDGSYSFDMPVGRVYRLSVTSSADHYAFPSTTVAPQSGFSGFGEISPSSTPGASGNRPFYLRFDTRPPENTGFSNNHIALDSVADRVLLDFRTNRKTASLADVVSYSANLQNHSGNDLTSAEGKPLYLSFAMARGVSINLTSVRATIRRASGVASRVSAGAIRTSQSSDRLIRFGPFDVPTGSTLEVRYQATIGIDTKAGRYDSRLVATDSSGVALSPVAIASLAIVKDRELSTSTILGRVYCDSNANGQQEATETGVFGARIYSDSGRIATSDALGRFHFTRISPGSHVFKLDSGSLAGGTVDGPETQLLVLSEGLPMQLHYAVSCARQWVDSESAQVLGTKGKPNVLVNPVDPAASLVVHGRISPMTLSVDGQRQDLPSAELMADFPRAIVATTASGSPRLVGVPKGGYVEHMPRWKVVWTTNNTGRAESWRFTIERVHENGVMSPVLHRSGAGAPPPVLDWNGLSDGGVAVARSTYVARLTLSGSQGVVLATAWHVFATGSDMVGDAKQIVLTDKLFAFSSGKPVATERLRDLVTKVAATLGSVGRVRLEVHGDGVGDRLKAAAQTQHEAKLILEEFVAAGVGSARVEARGRGASEPLTEGRGPEARKQNRRLVLTVTMSPGSQKPVPKFVIGKEALRFGGRLAPIAEDGSFSVVVPRPINGILAVDMLAASGRRIVFPVKLGKESELNLDTKPQSARDVSGDLATKQLRVDFATAPADLWTVDAQLAAIGALPIPELRTEINGNAQQLTSPLDFRLLVGSTLSVKRWELRITNQGGTVVHRESGKGPVPAIVRWDGRESGVIALRSGERYQYQLHLETSDSSSASSAARWFEVDPKTSAEVLNRRARFFKKTGSPRANLRNLLSRFVARQTKGNDRYSILLEIAGDQPRVDSVRAGFVAYLEKLGLASSRYDLTARELVARRDRISIVRDTRPRMSTPEVRINRRLVALQGSTFRESLTRVPGVPLIVEIKRANGAALRFVSSRTEPGITETAGGALIPPGPIVAPAEVPSTVQLVEESSQGGDTPAKRLRVHLPEKGIVLGESRLAIIGSVAVGSDVTVNGGSIAVRKSGAFHVIVPLPIGESNLVIRAKDNAGGSSTIVWPVEVAKSHSIVVGLAEGVAATSYTTRGWFADTAAIATMGKDSTLQVGPLLLSARAQGFVKARFPGGSFSDTVEVTAHINTAREPESSAFFEQVLDSNRSFPLLGDDANEVQDANTRGKLYAKVEAGDSSATIGSVHTRLEGGGELFSYDRTADGVVADVQRAVGDQQVALRAFATSGSLPSARDINWFRATGGSLYYLRHGHVLEGSEKVQIVVRDRDSGVLLSKTDLTEGADYTVEYEGGRVRLTEPLTGANRSPWVLDNMDSSNLPMSGNLVYVSIQYEHSDNVATSQTSRGAYASTTIEQRLSIGAGIATEDRGATEAYRLLGVDAALNLGEHSHISAELAASRQRDAGHYLSSDGGMSFGALQRDIAFDEPGSVDSLSGMHMGWKLSADLALRDWSKSEKLRDTSLSLYYQDLDRGFASGGAVFDQGRLKFGGRLRHRLSPRDRLLVRHEGQIAQLPRVGPTLTDVMDNSSPELPDERASYLTSVQWARDLGRWHYKVEGMHQRISSTASLANDMAALDAQRVGVGTLAAYDISKRITVRAGQQVVVSQGEADPVLSPISPTRATSRSAEPLAGLVSNVGGEVQLAPELSATADFFQRWNGDNALRIGLRSALSDRGSMYVQEQVGGVGGRVSNTTIVGAEDSFGADNGGRTYGEYQVNRGVLGNRSRSVLGLGRRWNITEKLGLGAGYEHQQAFGGFLPDGTAIGDAQRNVGHTSLTYVPSKTFRFGAQVELRLDHGDSGTGVDPGVLGDDPRAGQLPGGFAEHDGVAPGAALVIAPGEQMQILGGLGAQWRLHDQHTWLARARSSLSTHTSPGAGTARTLARFTELTTGWAFRPIASDRLEFLSRYSYLHEQRPSLSSQITRSEYSHVLAILPYARLPRHILLSGKLALKRSVMKEGLALDEEAQTQVSTVLAIARIGYQFYGNWDTSGELRALVLWGDVDQESKLGSLLELGYSIGRHLRLGAGYNFSHFSDNELGDLTRDTHGFFLRMTGFY